MEKADRLTQLPPEILSELLTWLDQPLYNENLERRGYLSQESFALPALPDVERARDLASIRLTCKRLAEAGAVHQFAKISTRFSQRDLDRLDRFCNWPHLAKHVVKFSYLVKNFYTKGPEFVNNMPAELENDIGVAHITALEAKLREQDCILNSEQDERVLSKALGAFKKLQHVQILRVQDQEDDLLLQRLRQHHEISRFFDLGWADACAHSTSIIGRAIMISQSPCSRFSSPMLSPQSASVFAAPLPKYMPLASKLTSLEIHFDDGLDLDERMLSLSDVFRTIFTAAVDMQAIHIGFPSHRPVNLKLEGVFHHVQWRNLKAFGIQSWRLDAEEIIAFVRRHNDRLRGLRLRDVLLKDGSNWTDVLACLRNEMSCLNWVSLRRIGYSAHYDELLAFAGAEVADDPADFPSDSEGGEETDSSNPLADVPMTSFVDEDDTDGSSMESVDGYFDHQINDEEEAGPSEQQMDFPIVSLTDPSPVLHCTCGIMSLYPLDAVHLGDNGRYVSNNYRKMWEKWVVRRCPIHGSPATLMNTRI